MKLLRDWQTFVILLLHAAITPINSILTDGPVSVSVLIGENALFHCNGSGVTIVWRVDGLLAIHPFILERGITPDTPMTSSGTVQSTLTVPATLVNNGTTVQCVIHPSGVTSNNATLTVLPGIDPVVNVRFSDTFNAVEWDPPATAGVLSGLSYIVIVMNNNTGQVIVNVTTNNTSYPLPVLESCQYYTANVTAFSSQHHSESVVTKDRVPGVVTDVDTSILVSITKHTNRVSPTPPTVLADAVLSTTPIIATVVPVVTIVILIIVTLSIVILMVHKHNKTKPAPVVVTVYQQESMNSYVDMKELNKQNLVQDELEVSTTPSTIASGSTAVDNHDLTYMEARSEYLSTHQEPTLRPEVSTIPPTIASVSTAVDIHEPTYMEARSEFLSTRQEPTKPKEPVYDDIHGSANPPAAESVQTDETKELHYAQEQPIEPVKCTLQTGIFGPGNKFIETQKSKEPVNTELCHSTNPPAPPPAELASVQIATVKEPQIDNTVHSVQPNAKKQVSHYADLHHSTNPPAPPLHVKPLQYATVKKQTDNTETTQPEDKVESFYNVSCEATDHIPSPPAVTEKPQPCKESSSGYHSGSLPIVGVSGPSLDSSGKCVYLQPSTYHAPLTTSTVLLSSEQPPLPDCEDVPYNHHLLPVVCDDTHASHEHVIYSPVASANSPVDAEARGGAIYEPTVNDVSSHCIDHFFYCGKDLPDELLIPSEPQYEPEGDHTMILGTVCTETDSSLSQDEFVFSVDKPVFVRKPDANEEMVIGIKTVNRPEFHLSVLYLLTCGAESSEETNSTTQMVHSVACFKPHTEGNSISLSTALLMCDAYMKDKALSKHERRLLYQGWLMQYYQNSDVRNGLNAAYNFEDRNLYNQHILSERASYCD